MRFLRRDHPGGWRAWATFTGGGDVFRAWAALAHDPRAADAFAVANGAPFFEWYRAHPERHAAFDAAMAAGARMHALAIDAAIDFATYGRVCDVGGGTGALVRTLLERHRGLSGVVLDLPEVIARAERAPRLELVAGDAGRSVPAGCDAYLLVNVVHDWDDDTATTILRNVAAARRPGADVLVVEHERSDRPRDGVSQRSDVLMLALTAGGRERTRAEIAELARRAGLVLVRTVPLASGDAVHVLR